MLRFTHPDKTIQASFDDIRLRMAIENLVDNASKYSGDNTTITVIAKQTAKGVSISVTDQGVGIAKEDFKKLFQKFSRIPNELSTSSGGSGLGLYWAQKIVKLHGGALTIKSEPGKGSTFTITLPQQ